MRKVILGFLCIIACTQLYAKIPDTQLAFIGLVGDSWHIFVTQDETLKRIDSVKNPRAFSFNPRLNKIVYVGSDSILYEFDLTTNRARTFPIADKASRYIQPYFTQDDLWLLAVELPNGKSRKTNIVGFRQNNEYEKHYFVRKRTAQFEPHMRESKHLYYSTASCVEDCEGMIWEIWEREMDTAKQRQITLLNTFSNQPHISSDGWLYFSSNASQGYFNIWKTQPVPNTNATQVSFGEVRDSEPTTNSQGTLYFIRKTPAWTKIMKLVDDQAVEVELPNNILDIRNLEVQN